MTRDPNLKASRLAKRSSFWRELLQDGQENSPRHSKRSSNVVVPLYDQLTSLKDWTEETAELCSAEEGRARPPTARTSHSVPRQEPATSTQSQSQPSASVPKSDSVQQSPARSGWRLSASRPSRTSQEVLPRERISEDSAMPLTRGPSVHVQPDCGHDWRQHLGTLSTHFKKTSIDKPSRSFSRSDFSSARPYEGRQQRPRRRTFIMADLHPHSSSTVALVESDAGTIYADAAGSLWGVGDSVLKSVLGSSLYQSTAGVCCG